MVGHDLVAGGSGMLAAGLLAYRERDDALGLTAMAGEIVADARAAGTAAMLLLACCGGRPVFGRLAGYEDVNDAEPLRTAKRKTASGTATMTAPDIIRCS
jgi:hypothetical protein